MNRPSTRFVLAGITLCVLGGSATAASAGTPSTGTEKDHTICLINQDGPSGPQHGFCVTIPLGSRTTR